MKEKILKLREDGKSYNEIKNILGCSKGTISYHCGDNQKEKTTNRRKKRRETNKLVEHVDRFKYQFKKRKETIRKFNKRDGNKIDKTIIPTFTWEDVLNKFGENTVCYLSGEKINLINDKYSLDHILPVSRGGDNSFNNLGITNRMVNNIKTTLTPDELIEWCVKILKHNGYYVNKK